MGWILTTHCIADAFYIFSTEKQYLIIRYFITVELLLLVDGSQDYELDIKGFENLEISDWREIRQRPKSFADIRTTEDNYKEVEFCVDLEEHNV